MATDTNSGIAFITMFDSSGGALTNGEQFSGVLIAPDEILTSAHGVVDQDGNVRNAGTAYLGYNGGALTGGVSIASVHVLDTTHRSGGMESDSAIASDFAVIKLSAPVTTATTFALGLGTPGTYTISGYPGIGKGALTSVTESLGKGLATGEMTGGTIVPGSDGAGASGSAVYSLSNGSPTVYGLYAAEDGIGHAQFTSLTSSDIDQIKAWVYADDAGQSWGAQFAPTQGSGNGTSQTPAATPTPAPVASTDRLDQIASLLTAGAASASPQRSAIMKDVATSLTMAREQGNTGGDIPDAAYSAAGLLSDISGTPKRAIAYMVGVMAGDSGIAVGRIASYAANVFGIDLGSTMEKQIARAGYAEEKTFAYTAGASISDLATAIAGASSPAGSATTMTVHTEGMDALKFLATSSERG